MGMKTTTNATIMGTCYPHSLVAGELLHVRADGVLSTVTSTRKGPAGTEIISFADHADIIIAGETKVVVFS
jgi:hypothetical protein